MRLKNKNVQVCNGCDIQASIPDISYAVSELAKFSANPGTDHWNGLIRILAYLKGTANYGLCYGNGTLTLYGVVDASYARCPARYVSMRLDLMCTNGLSPAT